MPEEKVVQISSVQIDIETRDLLRKLADLDFRSLYSELRWLVRQEIARRNGEISEQEQSTN